jgi:hypothetical protein
MSRRVLVGIVIETTEAVTTKRLFDSFYVIPDFQRDFVWKRKQVVQLLVDMYGAFHAGDDDNYFVGSIVVFKTDKGSSLAVVDGQQRLATLYLLFCALRDRLKEFDPTMNVPTLDQAIASADITASGDTVMRHRVELRYKASSNVLHAIGEGQVDTLELDKIAPGRPLLDAYRFCKDFLFEKFGEEDQVGLKKFHAFVLSQVEMIRITSGDFHSALTIFEILNYRGVVLNAMDLLKNLLFRVSEEEQHAELVSTWDEMLGILRRGGETRPLRFLRYYLVATYDFPKMPRASELFQWVLDNDDAIGYSKNPLRFVSSLRQGALDYTNILSGLDPWEDEDIHLLGILYQKTGVSQHLPILLAGAAHLNQVRFHELAMCVESLVFAYTLAGAQWNDIEQVAPGWCLALREVQSREDFDRFLAQVRRRVAEVAPQARESLRQTNSIGSGLLRYTMAKLTHQVEVSCGKDDDFFKYFKKIVTIEHVLPQKPSPGAAKAFNGNWEPYVYRLGNLMLLYGGPNSIARNKPFKEKVPLYEASDFELTKSLVADIRLGKQDKTSKTADRYGFKPFAVWDPHAVEERETILLEIASDIWGL